MLADVVNQLKEYVKELPVCENVLDEALEKGDSIVSPVWLYLAGQFKIVNHKSEGSVSYHGHLIAFENLGRGSEEVDNGHYEGIQDVVDQIKEKAKTLVSGINYNLRGLTYNCSDIWLTLERKLLSPEELEMERAEIRETFPAATETYEV